MLRKLSKSERGMLISWMSSGNIIIFTWPPLSFRALEYCRPFEIGTRRSAPPRSIRRGAFTCTSAKLHEPSSTMIIYRVVETGNVHSKYGQLVISDRRGKEDQVKGTQRHIASLQFHRPPCNTNLGCQWCRSSVTGCRQDSEQLPRQIYLEPDQSNELLRIHHAKSQQQLL
uniref:Uncharacterized protein n=1 Tax=Arundo donax TaxID=35708 RepID=A0A0A9GHM9_ARUDO